MGTDAVRREFPNQVLGWTQQRMNILLQEIEQCWPTEEGREVLRRVAKVLHLYGDRHAHVGTFDTLSYLRAETGQLAIRLGPTKRWVP